jgi:hypothetical protein
MLQNPTKVGTCHSYNSSHSLIMSFVVRGLGLIGNEVFGRFSVSPYFDFFSVDKSFFETPPETRKPFDLSEVVVLF